MKALDIRQTIDFVPSCDKDLPDSEQTVFVVQPLSPMAQAVIENEVGYVEGGRYHHQAGAQNLALLHLGLVDVRNLKDSAGQQVAFCRTGKKTLGGGRYDEIEQDFLARIPKSVRDEVARFIDSSNSIETDRGN